MSYNRTLWAATGQQIGREARAAMNDNEAFSTFWTPVVNLAREPRWGRNIEVTPEDPFASGEYAEAFVKGFEHSKDDLTHVQASACCKHYVANEMESSCEVGDCFDRQHVDTKVNQQVSVVKNVEVLDAAVNRTRWPVQPSASFCARGLFRDDPDQGHVHVNVTTSNKNQQQKESFTTNPTQPQPKPNPNPKPYPSKIKQDLVDSYMYPFQVCVEKGQVTSLMCSYNSVNGVPSCANGELSRSCFF